jgi:hypothetical protein
MPRDRNDLLLLLQGGLGNQLMQLVLAESLAKRLGLRLVGSQVLLDSRSRRLRGLTSRSLSPLVQERVPLRPGPWHRHLLPRLAARLGQPLDSAILTDRLLLDAATGGSYLLERLERVRVIHSHATHPRLFGAEFAASWRSTLAALRPYRRATAVQVAVHVRRTDYLNPRSGFVPLDLPYYRAALTRALGAVPTGPTPTVVHVCSDDPAWCRSHLQDPSWKLEIACGSPEQDLATMVEAQVLITGNSSFSAVAGHLAQLREARTPVLTPGCWLRNPEGRLGDLRKADWQVVIP